jgi:hypothetical protein
MEIVLVTLDDLRPRVAAQSREDFVAAHPGAFFLAMGYLAVEYIRRSTKRFPTGERTEAFYFGSKLRHAEGDHPLAGSAFFLRPTGDQRYIVVGRGNDCDLTIPDMSVSDEHCVLAITDEGVTVTDNDSTNGTAVNLRRLEPHRPKLLADEDILTVGRYSFQLLSAQAMHREIAILMSLRRKL